MKIRLTAVLMGIFIMTGVFAGGKKDEPAQPQKQTQAAVPYTIEVGGSTSVTPLMELFAAE